MTSADTRQRQASDPASSAWVSASAGTGKTKVLTDRVLRLLLTGTPPERLLCLTFTRAAAAEMANRLNQELAKWTGLPDDRLTAALSQLVGAPVDLETVGLARRLLARVLETPGGMRILTVHAFCQSLLARFPIEAGVPTHFSVADERAADEMIATALDDLFFEIQSGRKNELEAALATVVEHSHELGFPELLGYMLAQRPRLARSIYAMGGLNNFDRGMARALGVAEDVTEQSLIAAACRDEVFDLAGLTRAAEALEAGSETDVRRGHSIAGWLGAGADRERLIDDYALNFLTKAGTVRSRLATKDAVKADPSVIDVLSTEADRLIALAQQRNKVIVSQTTTALMRVGNALMTAFTDLKRIHNWLDYEDLITLANSLLTAPGAASWVLYKLDGGLDHVLIDEAQDTNPEQWQIVESIAEEFFAGLGARDIERTVFAVGDPKQSIYSFQRADPDAFAAVRDRFADRATAAGGKWADVSLDLSFRSTVPVLAAVDAVFARPPAREGVVPDGVEVHHGSARVGAGGVVEVWPSVTPPESEDPDPWLPPATVEVDPPAPARLAQLLAARIADMCHGGEILESRGRPIVPGDIMVLVRRRTTFVEDLVRALKDKGIAVAGVDRLVLGDHIAVQDLIALGRFLLMPDDDLELAVVLKGPMIGLDDDQLFELAYDRPASLWAALRQRHDADPRYRRAYTLLRELLGLADRMPPHELYAAILGTYRGRHDLIARLGPEAADPIDEFLAQTLAFQRLHPGSLQGFLHWFETGSVEIKRDLEHGEIDAVRVLTVHGAKGLQAPIVFLPDTMQVPKKAPPLLWMPEDQGVFWPPRRDNYDELCESLHAAALTKQTEEYRRLLYVAMTRAEDRLYVCGWETNHTVPDDCWYNLIIDGLAAQAELVEDPAFADLPFAPDGPLLRLTMAQDRAIATEPPSPMPPSPDLPVWARVAAPSEPPPAGPVAPSGLEVADAPDAAVSPLIEQAAARGRIIHRLLEQLPGRPSPERHDACQRYLARQDLEPAQQDQIERAVNGVLDDAAFAPLFGPDSRAEVAFSAEIDGADGPIRLSGQIDRLCVDRDAVLIVDYKTGPSVPSAVEATPVGYLRQMAAYWRAMREIYPDRTIRCHLLWTAGPVLHAIPETVLAAHAP